MKIATTLIILALIVATGFLAYWAIQKTLAENTEKTRKGRRAFKK